MKKLKYLMILLCFSFILIGCNETKEVETVSNTTPLLLEVTKEGSNNKLYLFGSIHAAEEDLYPLPKYVTDAYKKSDTIAVEFDLVEYEKNLSNQVSILSRFINAEGKEIQDYLDEESYNKCVEILKNGGVYSPLYDNYSPMMWYSLVESALISDTNLDIKYGIDKYFLESSKKDRKEILELESAEYQYDILLGFDYEEQADLLKQSINEYEEAKNQMKKLYELYKTGDKNELEKLVFVEEESNELMEEFNNKLITIRNQNMKSILMNEFNDGKNIFCTVGIAHIIGQDGIADLLEKENFTVKIIK